MAVSGRNRSGSIPGTPPGIRYNPGPPSAGISPGRNRCPGLPPGLGPSQVTVSVKVEPSVSLTINHALTRSCMPLPPLRCRPMPVAACNEPAPLQWRSTWVTPAGQPHVYPDTSGGPGSLRAPPPDLQLLAAKLNKPVDLKKYTPACLASTGDSFVGKTAWVYGEHKA